MKKIDKLLSKLKKITNTKSDKELCVVLDINYSTLDTWKNKDKIPEKRLLSIAEKLSINYEDLDSFYQTGANSQQIKTQFNKSSGMVVNTSGEKKLKNEDEELQPLFDALVSVATAFDKKEKLKNELTILISKLSSL